MPLPHTLVLLAALQPAADLRIDHVTIAGKNLEALATPLRAVNLTVEPGGQHTNHATEMSILSFPDGSYIELIALQQNYDRTMLQKHDWAKLIEGDAGPAAWAVRPKDFAKETARLKSLGVPVVESQGGRQRSDRFQLAWQTTRVGSEGTGAFFPFLIRDDTPRDKRAFPNGKPGNRDQSGVVRVVIAVSSLSGAADRFRKAYPDLAPPLRQVDPDLGAQLAWIPDTPVIFAAPLGSTTPVARRLADFGEGPCAFLLGSRKTRKLANALPARWFGHEIQWWNPKALGYWLGTEQQ